MSSIESGFDPAAFDDDLEAELAPLRRRRLPLLTALLALALAAAGAFVGGVEIQKHFGGSSASTGGRSPQAGVAAGGRRIAAGGGRAGRSPGGAGAGIVAGQVTLIKGSTLYVSDGGNTVEVTTAGASVSKTVTTSVKGIDPGDTVVVRGTKAKNGSYRASSISLGGASFGGGGFGGRSGAAGGFPSGFGGGGSNGNG